MSASNKPAGALSGLLVVDLTTHLSGPYCGMMLGDHGAEIIKIERPEGDAVRGNPPFVNGESASFMTWNRNKQSVVLDLKDPGDLAILKNMISKADILLQNMRPGVCDRLGIGWEDVHALNPRLIYGSVSAYGMTGPYAERPGFDLIMQGFSGLAAVCGPKGGEPHRLPISISDVVAGMLLTIGVLAAVEARHKTGEGQHVDTSLMEAALAVQLDQSAYIAVNGSAPPRLGQGFAGSAPYQIYVAKDGALTIGAAAVPHFWKHLLRILDLEHLEKDPRFAVNADRVTNNDELTRLLEERLATRNVDEWLPLLAEAGIPSGPVLTTDQALAHPQSMAREMFVKVSHPLAGEMKTLGIPVKLSSTPPSIRTPAPTLGQHTEEVKARFSSGL